jgi:hypothetical protein
MTTGAHLVAESLRFSVQFRIVALLTQRMTTLREAGLESIYANACSR